MERSFAKSTRYGFDQAQWRGLWRMRIQEYLTCAIQNIQVMIKQVFKPNKGIVSIAQVLTIPYRRALSLRIVQLMAYFGVLTAVDNLLGNSLVHIRSS